MSSETEEFFAFLQSVFALLLAIFTVLYIGALASYVQYLFTVTFPVNTGDNMVYGEYKSHLKGILIATVAFIAFGGMFYLGYKGSQFLSNEEQSDDFKTNISTKYVLVGVVGIVLLLGLVFYIMKERYDLAHPSQESLVLYKTKHLA